MATYVLIGSNQMESFESEILSCFPKQPSRVIGIGVETASSVCVEPLMIEHIETAEDAIRNADVILIGESSLPMIRALKRSGIDRLLRQASQTDKLICGIGEGANLLCAYGQTCTDKITSRRMTGWGLVELVFCPHVVDEPQRTGFLKSIMKRTYRLPAVALDHAALVIDGERYRVVSAIEGSRARKCYWYKGQYYTDNIKSNEWHPLEKLMRKG